MKNSRIAFCLGVLGALVVPGAQNRAHAFSIEDHSAITAVAFSELRSCSLLPAGQDTLEANVTSADIDEDLNLVRKWTNYSHYYHPFKKLDMRRADSSVTIRESETELAQLFI